MTKLVSIFSKMADCSSMVLREYVSEFLQNNLEYLRFFSYGSNMNEGKFREDTRENGYELGLEHVKKGILQGYKRILGNRSKNHGLAFTICHADKEQVEGICHDIPIAGLEPFLKKEGLFLDEPSYEILIVSVAGENNPVLALKGLKPRSLEKLSCRDKLKVVCYVNATIEGAKRWNVDYSDISIIKNALERELCGKTV